KLERLGADIAGMQIHRCIVNRGFAAGMRSKLIGAKRAGLERNEPRSGAGESDIGRGFALEHLTDEDELATFAAAADAVANHALAEHGGEFRCKVADLISVREEHEVRLDGFDDLFKSNAKAIGSISVQQVMLDQQNFGDIFSGDFRSEPGDTFADD